VVGRGRAEPGLYRLPWAAGAAHSVLQGNSQFDDSHQCTSGCSTHNDDSMRFAFDFDLPEGTPVLAARAGAVVLVNGNWRSDHCGGLSAVEADGSGGQNVGNETNFVEIDHGDGTSALYLHLSRVSANIERKVKTQEHVDQGEVLGRSGKTGFTQCVPHLHFQVQASARADWFTTSRPVAFADHDVIARTGDGVPVEGESYDSDNVPVGEVP
jgi:murein DD-endopeptidase MepM/ murein hydrolase activator NlpD